MAPRHARPHRAFLRDAAASGPALPYCRGAQARPSRGRKALRIAQSMLAGSAVVTGAALVGVLGGNSTLALWQSSQTYDAGTLYAADGELSLRFAVGDALAASTAFEHLLPGESQTKPVVITNDGDYALALSAELLDTVGAHYELRLELDEGCQTSGYLTSSAIGGAAMAEASPVSLGTITAGATRTLCVEATATSAITPGSSASFDVSILGSSGS